MLGSVDLRFVRGGLVGEDHAISAAEDKATSVWYDTLDTVAYGGSWDRDYKLASHVADEDLSGSCADDELNLILSPSVTGVVIAGTWRANPIMLEVETAQILIDLHILESLRACDHADKVAHQVVERHLEVTAADFILCAEVREPFKSYVTEHFHLIPLPHGNGPFASLAAQSHQVLLLHRRRESTCQDLAAVDRQ